ncbi:MAG: HAD-IIIC family phosphatase [Saprospiraceae bacterium]|nr:HAD-IIIC family phosphatase [Saprospiraceae bacterium]
MGVEYWEDGPQSIMLGGSYPGSAYKDFQKLLLEIKETGVILAVCSKNNESDVLNLWENHPDMILKKTHFSAWRINWDDKAQNVIEIAEELNIDTGSILFIDDNPTERERVKTSVSGITVPDFPSEPYLLRHFSEKLLDEYFKVYKATDEDLNKTEQYKFIAQRKDFQNNFSSIDDFIRKLEIELTLNLNNPYTFSRVAQMTQKTKPV